VQLRASCILAMNSMWFLGAGAAHRGPSARLDAVGADVAVRSVSNFAQYLFGGPGILRWPVRRALRPARHCWLYQKLAPNEAYRLPPGVVVLMLVWLVICLTGVIEVLSFGALAIANAAHVGGLVAGCVTGVIGGTLARRR